MYSRLLQIVTLLLASLAATAAHPAAEFSAVTVDSQPGQEERTGRLFVGKDRIRTDMEMNGETIIQIIDLGRQEAIVINSAQKSYMRRRAGSGEMPVQSRSAKDANPCAGMKNLVCNKAGSETINGRKAQKWEITNPQAAQDEAMYVWLDAEHGIPVRQEMPDGFVMEMHMLKREKANGRNTEKWEMKASHPDGQSQTSVRWYDPEIGMNVREEMPGGFTRNLTNIKLQAQPAEVFSIPEGYTEISMPQQPAR